MVSELGTMGRLTKAPTRSAKPHGGARLVQMVDDVRMSLGGGAWTVFRFFVTNCNV